MILALLFLIMSICISGNILYFTNLYLYWYYILLFIFLIPVFFVLIFLVYLILVFLWSLLLRKTKERTRPHRFYYFWVRQTAILLLLYSRTRVKVIGKELLDPKKRYMVISNHISTFDPIVAMAKLGLDPLICVSKKENFNIPICGPFIHHAGFIELDRTNNRSAIRMINRACSDLEKDLASIYICPEGTRSKTGELLPFHPGSFKIATRANVSIVICHIENTHLIAKHFPFRGTKTKLEIVKVISIEEIQKLTTAELADMAYNILLKKKENEQ